MFLFVCNLWCRTVKVVGVRVIFFDIMRLLYELRFVNMDGCVGSASLK